MLLTVVLSVCSASSQQVVLCNGCLWWLSVFDIATFYSGLQSDIQAPGVGCGCVQQIDECCVFLATFVLETVTVLL